VHVGHEGEDAGVAWDGKGSVFGMMGGTGRNLDAGIGKLGDVDAVAGWGGGEDHAHAKLVIGGGTERGVMDLGTGGWRRRGMGLAKVLGEDAVGVAGGT